MNNSRKLGQEPQEIPTKEETFSRAYSKSTKGTSDIVFSVSKNR